jgi:hypothetical protein
LFLVVACGGGGNITNLPLRWQGLDDLPRASGLVARAFTVSPLSFGLRDLRPDPSAVGSYEDTGFVVRTTDNVGQYCTNRVGEMLVHAGAHLEPAAPATLEVDLLDYHVVEGGTFDGTVRMRTTLRRGADVVWSKTYTGKGQRWGRTHNPENFNEALSHSLADATRQLLMDDEFAQTLGEPPVEAPLLEPSPSPPGAAPPSPGASAGSSGG